VVLDCYYAWNAMDAVRDESHANALDAPHAKSPFSGAASLPAGLTRPAQDVYETSGAARCWLVCHRSSALAES
jgi:hypothetical protein